MVALLREVGREEALHETLVAAFLVPRQRRANLYSLRAGMGSTVAATISYVCSGTNTHPKASLLLPLRAPL